MILGPNGGPVFQSQDEKDQTQNRAVLEAVTNALNALEQQTGIAWPKLVTVEVLRPHGASRLRMTTDPEVKARLEAERKAAVTQAEIDQKKIAAAEAKRERRAEKAKIIELNRLQKFGG